MPKGRKKSIPKVKPPKVEKLNTDLSIPPFHICFPHLLTHTDGTDDKKCWFTCSEHMETYIQRYKLKKGTYQISKTEPKNPLDAFFQL